jgi:glycosyltransferase 2 family protein
MKGFLLRTLIPWCVTALALLLAFRNVEWSVLGAHISDVRLLPILTATALTVASYLLRARRWPLLFPSGGPPYAASLRVLILGFFMNNILPARAGELVRAHAGGQVTGQSRALVLATIAAERLLDGVTLSLILAVTVAVFGESFLPPHLADPFLVVAYLFGAAALGVVIVVLLQHPIHRLIDRLETRLNGTTYTYAVRSIRSFLLGLSPLVNVRRAPALIFWSILIWSTELGVFVSVVDAYGSALPLLPTIVFLVAVNFSGLIPAAPGGFGVIELIASQVLQALGVPSPELALSMVISQHAIQYLVVGIPGLLYLATWQRWSLEIDEASDAIASTSY